jgi:hypothetical protein
MNGVPNMLGIDQSAELAKAVCEAVLSTCSPAAENTGGAAAAVHKRSTLSQEMSLSSLLPAARYSVLDGAAGGLGSSVAGLLSKEVEVVAASCRVLFLTASTKAFAGASLRELTIEGLMSRV